MDRLKMLSRTLLYKGHRVKVYEDVLEKPDGEKVYYDYVENRNGSGVLLVDEDGKLIFVRQYRTVIDDMDIEIPAGCIESGDDIVSGQDAEGSTFARIESDDMFRKCALREAEEETGLIPGKLFLVNKMVAAVGLFSERTAIYIGTELTKGSINRDSDEYIDIIKLTLEEAVDYVYQGKIVDSKTIIAIFAYKDLKNSEIL